jgi:hypothetical protein
MKTKTIIKACSFAIYLATFGLSSLSTELLAQPVVNYTVSGTSGNYVLDFTINNTTPGTQGFDIYFFGVLVNGIAIGTPPGYNFMRYTTVHTLETEGPALNWPFNNTWIDLNYSELPTGSTLSGFKVTDNDLSAPTSVQYFAYGENNGMDYSGPGAVPGSPNLSNPLFIGNATVSVPEPTSLSIFAGASMLFLSGVRRYLG